LSLLTLLFSLTLAGESSQHQADHRNLDHGLATLLDPPRG
jgi:hypothetical protein